MNTHGIIVEPGTVRFERMLPGPIERVWEYLTDSEKRGKWLATGEMELHVGGRVELNFFHADLTPHQETIPEKYQESCAKGHRMVGRVTRCEPPHVLSYTWEDEGKSEVTFELAPRNEKVLLTLTHRRLADRKEMLSVAGGWHTHLGILVDRMEGHEPAPFWATHARLEKEYDELFPAGPEKTALQVSRKFPFSAERVFDAWLDPAKAQKFLFATATGEMVRVEIDGRVGGRYAFVDRREGEDVEHVGEYLEIDRPRRLVFTLQVPKYSREIDTVSLDIRPVDDGCELTLTHELSTEWLERTRAGWGMILEASEAVI